MKKADEPAHFTISEYYGTEDPRDGMTFRALVHWLERDGVRAQSFSVAELEVHISACQVRGESTERLECAMLRLRCMNEPDLRREERTDFPGQGR